MNYRKGVLKNLRKELTDLEEYVEVGVDSQFIIDTLDEIADGFAEYPQQTELKINGFRDLREELVSRYEGKEHEILEPEDQFQVKYAAKYWLHLFDSLDSNV